MQANFLLLLCLFNKKIFFPSIFLWLGEVSTVPHFRLLQMLCFALHLYRCMHICIYLTCWKFLETHDDQISSVVNMYLSRSLLCFIARSCVDGPVTGCCVFWANVVRVASSLIGRLKKFQFIFSLIFIYIWLFSLSPAVLTCCSIPWYKFHITQSSIHAEIIKVYWIFFKRLWLEMR